MRFSNGSPEPVGEASIDSVILKTVIFILLILLVLYSVPSASARYSLEGATTNITVDPNGIVHIREAISYAFDGEYIDVHRELKVLPGQSIYNIKGHCSDKACEFKVEPTPKGYRLVGELPKPSPKKLTLFTSYDLHGAVKVYSDTSEFNYKLWGGEWEKPVENLSGRIAFPVNNENEIRYWIHPPAYTQEFNIENNVINFKAKEIPSSQWYEIRVVFPRIMYPNSSFVQVNDKEGLEEILAIENEYQQKDLYLKNIYRFTVYFLLLILAFPFVIYLLYGRELKIDYQKALGNYEEIYERKPPMDSKPAEVNAIMKGRMGIPQIEGFIATVMDLANRGYISLNNLIPEEGNSSSIPKFTSSIPKSESRDFVIQLINNEIYSKAKGSLSELEDFEKDALYLLKEHASENKEISWSKFKKELGTGTDFYQFITSWNQKVKSRIEFGKFFQSTGITYMNWFSRFILVAAIIYYITITKYFPPTEFPLASRVNVLTALIGIFGFVMMEYSGMIITIFGRWTPEGSIYYKRWDDFKKYLTDLSALKDQPPESVKNWNSYLVYATSLGVVKKVLENMSAIVPPEQLKEIHLFSIIYNYNYVDYDFEGIYSSPIHEDGAGSVDDGGGKGSGGDTD